MYNRRGVWLDLLLPCFIKTPVFNANSVDPDQMPHSAVYDLILHCLPVSFLWDTRHNPVSFLYKSIAVRYRPVSYADGPITARYRFIKNAYWEMG